MQSVAQHYQALAEAVADSMDTRLWDEKKGAYKDNTKDTVPIYPQDGNSIAVWFNATRGNMTRARSISAYLHTNWNAYGSTTPEWSGDIGTFPGSMEVHAHYAARNATRAQELIRLQWGHMINSPDSTASTFWEGYQKDGTFAYGGRYMSNAHGWATGAASALSMYTLGVRVSAQTFIVEPYFGSVKSCVGRMGGVEVAWNVLVARGESEQNSAATVNITVGLDNVTTTKTGSVRVDITHLHEMLGIVPNLDDRLVVGNIYVTTENGQIMVDKKTRNINGGTIITAPDWLSFTLKENMVEASLTAAATPQQPRKFSLNVEVERR